MNVRAGYVCMPRGACRAVRLAPPVRTDSNRPALASWSVDMTWCWVCLQSTPQTQSANVTESSGEEDEAEEEAKSGGEEGETGG